MERNCDNCKYHDVYYNAPPCDECNFEYQRQPQKGFQNWESDAMTNADRIRAMRDEEMAELLRDYQCNTCDFSGFCEETDKCKEEIFKWLTQEVQQ